MDMKPWASYAVWLTKLIDRIVYLNGYKLHILFKKPLEAGASSKMAICVVVFVLIFPEMCNDKAFWKVLSTSAPVPWVGIVG